MTLEDAYAIAAHTPGAEEYPPRWAADAQAFRARMGEQARLNVPYGGTARQVFDLFAPECAAHGVVVFVHGGYWKAFDKSSWSHFAEGALARGWAVAMPSYDLCPDVRISDITMQIARAVTCIAESVAGPLVLTGHSAGGHLVARMLAPAMLPDAVARRIERVVPISPLADLEPLLHSPMNETFRLDVAEARAESPTRQPAPERPRVIVSVGANERPALLDQARWLSLSWNTELAVVPDTHHFDVIDALRDADSDLVRSVTGE